MSTTVVEVQQPAHSTSDPAVPGTECIQHDLSTSRKRKRGSDGVVPLDFKEIHIRPYPENIYEKPLLLRPLRCVPRTRLPLSYLDISATTTLSSPSRLFTAHIELLEHDVEDVSQAIVLIACLNDADTLFAIERVKPRVYALCQLYAWVKIGYIEEGPVAVLQHTTSDCNDANWWTSALVGKSQAPAAEAPRKRIRLSMTAPSSSCERKEEDAEPFATRSCTELPLKGLDANGQDAAVAMPMQEVNPWEIFESLVRQYLDAVYISKTSLAFFVKGPLSRARTSLAGSTNEDAMVAFTTQLRAMLLSMPQMDKKYRERLPEAIKNFPAHSLSDNETTAPIVVKKRRSKAVPKLSRDGCYPSEEDYCRRWWLDNQSLGSRAREGETFEHLVRRRVADLRRRETLAQIALILELLALEALPEHKASLLKTNEPAVEATQNKRVLDAEQVPKSENSATKKSKYKTKKRQDLDLLLDLLLDKLSIWQSIEQDLNGVAEIDKKQDSLAQNDEKLHEQDMLASFCSDVVIPFYKSRVPVQASLVNKKLGGPGAPLPAKVEKSKQTDAGKINSKPGERRSRKSLQKTLSDVNDFTRSRRPSLSRSATDLQGMPRIKREASELSLLDVPLARPSHRDSMSQLRHLQQRTVDMTAISTATEVKMKQKAKIEQDLKDAINTLKRPNRSQAVRELADSADRRSLGSASMRKKTMGPVRKILQSVRNVQVTATPKHKRVLEAFGPPLTRQEDGIDEQNAPSSGEFCVPSSGFRVSAGDVIGASPAASRLEPLNDASVISATPSKHSIRAFVTRSDAIAATPAKKSAIHTSASIGGSSKLDRPVSSSFRDYMNSQDSRKLTVETPMRSKSKKASVGREEFSPAAKFITPAKQNGGVLFSTQRTLDETPMKAASDVITPQEERAERSIYDALGWNDYEDV